MNTKKQSTGQVSITIAEDNDVTDSEVARYPQTFPDLVWKQISDKLLLANPSDLENLTNSLPFVRDLMSRQRTCYLYGKVFPLVASSAWEKEGLEGLPMSDVLKCRGVCAHWNGVIDKWIPQKCQSLSWKVDENNQSSSIKPELQSFLENTFTNSGYDRKSVQESLDYFEHTHPGSQPNGRNPLIWSNLTVVLIEDIQQEEGDQNFLNGISLLLTTYGSHIEKFSVQNEREDFFRNVARFREWLSHMPKLKSLKYNCNEGWNREFNLNDYPKVRLFPKLKYLHTLKVESLMEPVLNQLIRQNPQISTLSVSYWHHDNNFFKFRLPNLVNLELRFETAQIISKLTSSNCKWPVKTLKLFCHADFDTDLTGCAELFQMVQVKFAKTLVALDIDLLIRNDRTGETYRQILEDCKTYRLDLPKLKEIRITIPNTLLSLDFLLPMKHNLEEISVCFGYGCPVFPKTTRISGDIVQFLGFEGKMLQSNIWVIFKKLKKIEVVYCDDNRRRESKWYSREEWMVNNEYAS